MDIKKGTQLDDFCRLFIVEPTPGNKGQLLLRKDNAKLDSGDALCLSATMYYHCTLVYGATMPVSSKKEQDDLFHSFSQDDADSIARHSLKEVTQYLEQLNETVEIDAKIVQLPN